MSFLRLTDLHELGGQRVFIRADLNVPLDAQGRITDDTRIRASLPAILHALSQAACVMVTSHLGRPEEGRPAASDSLLPVADRLTELLHRPVRLQRHWVDQPFGVAPGEIVLLENCRINPGEKNNDDLLGRYMASLCDVYVNDAFGTAHRAEASTDAIARHAPIACGGPLLTAELEALGTALQRPNRPLVAIVAGSKVSTKLRILKSLANKVDHLIVGGGIANTFLAAQGFGVGKSLCEHELVREAAEIMAVMRSKGGTVPLPSDVVVATRFSADAPGFVKATCEIDAEDMILDIGPRASRELAALIKRAGTIVWNGPMGVFEFDAFAGGTRTVGEAIAASSAFSIAGGGDTIAAISRFGLENGIDYISTGGGAFLEFLEGRSLPAVAALEARGPALAARRA